MEDYRYLSNCQQTHIRTDTVVCVQGHIAWRSLLQLSKWCCVQKLKRMECIHVSEIDVLRHKTLIYPLFQWHILEIGQCCSKAASSDIWLKWVIWCSMLGISRFTKGCYWNVLLYHIKSLIIIRIVFRLLSDSLAAVVFSLFLFIPRYTKSGGVLCYTLRTLSVRSSVCLSVRSLFPCSNFSTFWPIFFKLCIDIGIGEEWYGIASGLISFWNNRVTCMALDVCQKCFALRFRALTLVRFYRFSSNFAQALVLDRSGMGLQVG